MTSDRQIEANRRNALKSTGPKTPEGKARSRRNAVKHGALATVVVGEQEDAGEFRELQRDLIEHFRPCTAMEELLVDRLAIALWRDRRMAFLEKREIDEMGPRLPSFKRMDQFLKFGRYTTMISREIERLMRMIEKEQAKSERLIDVTPSQPDAGERSDE